MYVLYFNWNSSLSLTENDKYASKQRWEMWERFCILAKWQVWLTCVARRETEIYNIRSSETRHFFANFLTESSWAFEHLLSQISIGMQTMMKRGYRRTIGTCATLWMKIPQKRSQAQVLLLMPPQRLPHPFNILVDTFFCTPPPPPSPPGGCRDLFVQCRTFNRTAFH